MIINISNKTAFVLLVIIAATLIVFVSNAYVYSRYTLDPGHTADKVLVDIPSVGEKDLQQAVVDRNLGNATEKKPSIIESYTINPEEPKTIGPYGPYDACFIKAFDVESDYEYNACRVEGPDANGNWIISTIATPYCPGGGAWCDNVAGCTVMCLKW